MVIMNRKLENQVLHGDCLEVMKQIQDNSIDMILSDLPYGTTKNSWDIVIDFESLWFHYERIIKNNGAIVLTSAQPFTSMLIMSNLKLFRYEIIWDKINKFTGFMNAKKMPLKKHENILVFYKKLPTYNPQMKQGKPYKTKRKDIHLDTGINYGKVGIKERIDTINNGERYPDSIWSFKGDNKLTKRLHPTIKPVELFEELIKTYTNKNEIVLDNCAGSGTTGIACVNTNRNYILIEKDKDYYNTIIERLGVNKNADNLL
jgi:site-specific DNA-methyltransferase (adenine-specific)